MGPEKDEPAKRLVGEEGEYLVPLPEGCPDPATDLLFPATGIITDESGTLMVALMFPAAAFPRWANTIAARAGEWAKGTAYCWLRRGADGKPGAGVLLDLLMGTEHIYAGVGLLEVPAAVDLFTKTGLARLYSDILEPVEGEPLPDELRALGVKRQGWVEECPYMKLQLGADAKERLRSFFEEIFPDEARP